jgi:hypothetical protein
VESGTLFLSCPGGAEESHGGTRAQSNTYFSSNSTP